VEFYKHDPDWAFRILQDGVPVAYRSWQESQLPSKCPTGKSLFWQPALCAILAEGHTPILKSKKKTKKKQN